MILCLMILSSGWETGGQMTGTISCRVRSMKLLPYLPVILLCVAAGCGLSDYEKRMDEQRQRIKEFEDVNLLLDEPLEIPSTKKPGGRDEMVPARPEIYLRLPKGFGSVVK